MSEQVPTNLMLARLLRWWYLLTDGMWKGECAVDVSDSRGISVLGSGREIDPGVVQPFRIWWERK